VVALRAAEAESFLARPDARRPIILVYGPDLGLVRERVETLLRMASESPDPFALVTLDGDVLAADPGRLSDEARTIGLFGARRLVHVRAGARNFNESLQPLLDDPPQQSTIVIEAGDLRKGAPLRSLLESSPVAAVIACYADGERELLRLVERTLADAGLAIDAEAREALVSLLGADRLATRSELDKLVIYADRTGRIAVEDVQAVISDASAMVLDDVVDAAAAGEIAPALAAFARARNAGVSATTILGAAIRHVALLHRLSLRTERAESATSLLERPEFRVHFRRRPRFERALKRHDPPALENALLALGSAALAARRTTALAGPIAEREILALARAARRRV
jgi:DNA polymerase-3 subunit delta